MEPWDGPAAIAFTDGSVIGACLDRNGLRPARYYVTEDDMIIMASEVGVLEVPPEKVIKKERLHPGRMLLVDTDQGRIVDDEELKMNMAGEHPYGEWIKEHMADLEELPESDDVHPVDHETLLQRQQAFGYTYEEVRKVLEPMATNGVEPVGAMGIDSPLAVLSDRPQLLYNYFKQLFAQVTNPPIDAIREEIITMTATTIGPERNLLKPEPESCRHIRLNTPLLTNAEMAKLRDIRRGGFKTATLPILFEASEGGTGLEQALEELCAAADKAVRDGATFLILSDRGMNEKQAPIPALLATSCLHHHLIRKGTRTRVSLLVESGEPREVHHFCLLLGYGASAINPYVAIETLDDMIRQNILKDTSHEEAVSKYIKAGTKGILKVLSKMGISTVQSYRGAQIFEAIGLDSGLIDKYFTWTASRIGGIGLDVIAEEALMRHRRGYSDQEGRVKTLDAGGDYQWRKDGEKHLYNPHTIHTLQQACRTNNYELYKQYSDMISKQDRELFTLRGLLNLKKADQPVPLDEVESVESICKRFKTGAMSYGSISKEAHESLAIAMNRIGGKSNTGEGGEDPGPLYTGRKRGSAPKRDQTGGVRPVRGHEPLSDQRRRDPDQDGPGRKTG